MNQRWNLWCEEGNGLFGEEISAVAHAAGLEVIRSTTIFVNVRATKEEIERFALANPRYQYEIDAKLTYGGSG